ncbi:hypothetical protein [Streptomyces sp. YS-3]|uniref:hypothetical protein n=1 Tax=Streptomyces sp. YS-3 TaxID=3381352 RepID=UPI0038626833
MSPTLSAPSAEKIAEAVNVLHEVEDFLREPSSFQDARSVLSQVLDEEYGVPMVLGNILRSSARLIEGRALLPWPVEIRHIVARMRAAAIEVTDCHDLHQDVRRLGSHEFGLPAEVPAAL